MTPETNYDGKVPWKSWFAMEDADLPELPDRLFRVWVVLIMIFARNRYRKFQVSDKRLAEICNVHPDTIKRCVIKLEEHGLIWMQRKQGKLSFYRILPVSEFKKYEECLKQFRVPRKKKKNTPLEEKELSATTCGMSSSTSLQEVT